MSKLNRYPPTLRTLRSYVIMIDGMPLVGRSKVIAHLMKGELKRFEKKYKWHKIYRDSNKFTRWAYFWDLHSLLDRRYSATI